MVIERQTQPLIIFTVDVPGGYAVHLHGDAIGDGHIRKFKTGKITAYRKNRDRLFPSGLFD